MRKIAIIRFKEHNCNEDYNSTYEMIAQSITDWSEVDETTYQTLQKAISAQAHIFSTAYGHLRIIERLDSPQFILNTVEKYTQAAIKWEREEQARKEAAEKAKQARLIKKQAKNRAEKLKLLEKLKEELGEQ